MCWRLISNYTSIELRFKFFKSLANLKIVCFSVIVPRQDQQANRTICNWFTEWFAVGYLKDFYLYISE